MRNALAGTLRFDQLLTQLRESSGRQAVLRVLPGRFLMFPEGSPRLAPIMRSDEWAGRVVGVFSPDVRRDVLLSEVM